MQRREIAKFGPRQSGGFASNLGSSQYQSVRTSSPDIAATSHYNDYKTENAKKYSLAWKSSDCRSVPAMKGKGMQLGGKTNARLKNALSNEISLAEESASHISSAPVASAPVAENQPPEASEGIQISLIETMSAKVNRDGNVESLEVQGQLNLQISDSTISRVQIKVDSDDTDGTQFKSHPNVDRNLFKDHHKIGLRDSSRSFPLNQQMSVLRWRLQGKADRSLPISG
jgi:coatomer subunit delta